jgi:hypothetical protein
MLIDVWDFTLPPDDPRRANLQAEGSFDAVAEDIRQKMEVLCCHPDPWGKIPPFNPVVYCIRVPAPVFDRFFNSQYGYRGAYFRSPFDGLSANEGLAAWMALEEARCTVELHYTPRRHERRCLPRVPGTMHIWKRRAEDLPVQ